MSSSPVFMSYFNSRPRERPTTALEDWVNEESYFNSRPRERPTKLKVKRKMPGNISTHDLVRGRQKSAENMANGWNFNSRPRERPTNTFYSKSKALSYFNSRPRERPTLEGVRTVFEKNISTHDLVRGRRSWRMVGDRRGYFNSRPRERPTRLVCSIRKN